MGKLTISMAIFTSKLFVITRRYMNVSSKRRRLQQFGVFARPGAPLGRWLVITIYHRESGCKEGLVSRPFMNQPTEIWDIYGSNMIKPTMLQSESWIRKHEHHPSYYACAQESSESRKNILAKKRTYLRDCLDSRTKIIIFLFVWRFTRPLMGQFAWKKCPFFPLTRDACYVLWFHDGLAEPQPKQVFLVVNSTFFMAEHWKLQSNIAKS